MDSERTDDPLLGTTGRAIDRVQRDPGAAWPDLLARVEDQLRVLLPFRMTAAARDVVDEDDLIQEVFAEMARHLDRFEYRGKGSLKRWLGGILRHKILEAERSGFRIPRPETAFEPPGSAPGSSTHLVRALTDTCSGASRDSRRRELVEKVRGALAVLPEPQREVILLKVYEGLSGVEAARRLGVPETTVSARFKSGLRALAPLLGGVGP